MREMQMQFCPIFSGSSGNAVYVACGETRLLVDAGVSGRRIAGELSQIGASPAALSGILVTHEHADHVAGVGVLSRRYDLPVYAAERAWRAMRGRIGEISARNERLFEPGVNFYIGAVEVMPFRTPHDAADPVGFVFEAEGIRIGVATDLGYMPPNAAMHLRGCDVLMIESNHDLDMLRDGPYPWSVKQRVMSRVGHLSNNAAAEFLEKGYDGGAAYVILAHLSESNNLPELARVSAEYALRDRMSLLGNRVLLATQDQPMASIVL